MRKPFLIFLVDDDLDDRELFADALTVINENIRLDTAVNGVDALEKLTNEAWLKPDYIFMDMNMPLMNGIECLKALKKIPLLADIKVIMYSTSSYSKDIQEAKDEGAFEYLVKPFSFPELCEKIRQIVLSDIS